MRKVPASVAVVTVAHLDPGTDTNVPMGIAVSSLNTVTLDPPTVSFNIKQPSQALNAIRAANGRFRVHFLDGHKKGLQVIEHFCRGNHPDAYRQRLRHLQVDVPQTEDLADATTSLAPRILGSALRAAAECSLTQELTVGDHVILVAQITGLESRASEDPTIAYVDGSYRRLGTKGALGYHGKKEDAQQPPAPQQDPAQKAEHTTMSRGAELSLAFDWPFVSGDQERSQYAERLKTYVRGIPGLRFFTNRDIVKKLQPETKLVSKSFGIDLVALVTFCQIGAAKTNQQILPEFYGRLSTTQTAKLVDRMKQLVRTDSHFLDVDYTELFRYLDVMIAGTNILPSDLLNPLRAEGLLAPFEPSEALLEANDRTILALEQTEHALRKQLSNLTDQEILRTQLPALFDQARAPLGDLMHFWEPHNRLKVESCSRFFTSWKMDITGDVTPEEALVVVRRLVDYVGIDRRQVYRTHMLEDVNNMMRNVGVHPLITGVNTTYVISKIRHLYASIEDFSALKPTVDKMLQRYYASTVTWDALQTRIEQFVQKSPLRVTSWKNRDLMAAMGMSKDTTIQTPLSKTPKSLDDSTVLDMLVAKALKNHYGNATEQENEAIATFLKDRYGFDVVRKAAVSPEEVRARSSADDLEAARLQHQHVVVPMRKPSSGQDRW